jgi:threonine dehydrogenase-like Zn-dependent dehydrogenase
MTKIARVGGMICQTGIHKAPHPVNLREINFKEQTLVGSRVYTKREFEQTVSYASQIRDDLKAVVTQVVPLSKSEGIFDMIADPAINTIKVLVDCTA